MNPLRCVGALLVGLLLTASPADASAQERWAALSVIGDKLTVVHARAQTGTHNNPNLVEAVPVDDGVFDKLALKAVSDAKIAGMPEIVLLGLRDPKLYEVQERLFEADGQALLDGLRKTLSSAQVTHVVLLAKARGEPRVALRTGHIGIGKVEGLGFYVDRFTRIRRLDTGETDRGFIAPFAYYRVMLFDLAANKVVGDEWVQASTSYPVASSGEGDPWKVIPAEKKVADLERLIRVNTRAALGRLVAARRGG